VHPGSADTWSRRLESGREAIRERRNPVLELTETARSDAPFGIRDAVTDFGVDNGHLHAIADACKPVRWLPLFPFIEQVIRVVLGAQYAPRLVEFAQPCSYRCLASLGYDFRSCELDGAVRCIEVKSARRSGDTLEFFVSENEGRRAGGDRFARANSPGRADARRVLELSRDRRCRRAIAAARLPRHGCACGDPGDDRSRSPRRALECLKRPGRKPGSNVLVAVVGEA
jgi:hypothetical protein